MAFTKVGGSAFCVFLAQIEDHHPRALCSQRFCGCLADTARRCRARDHDDLVLEQHLCLLSVEVMAQVSTAAPVGSTQYRSTNAEKFSDDARAGNAMRGEPQP